MSLSEMTCDLAGDRASEVFELRRYRLHEGARERLIDLFDREFVETQEAVGMRVLGQFRDLDDPDAFVWMRGFSDMRARAAALAAFYGGEVWARHREVANGTMIDSDNVLLLRLTSAGIRLASAASDRAPLSASGEGRGLVAATILHLDPRAHAFLDGAVEQKLLRRLEAAGADVAAAFETEDSVNTFPRLPVREGERVWMALTRHADVASHADVHAALKADPVWSGLRPLLVREPEILRLKPTARSLTHG